MARRQPSPPNTHSTPVRGSEPATTAQCGRRRPPFARLVHAPTDKQTRIGPKATSIAHHKGAPSSQSAAGGPTASKARRLGSHAHPAQPDHAQAQLALAMSYATWRALEASAYRSVETKHHGLGRSTMVPNERAGEYFSKRYWRVKRITTRSPSTRAC